MPEGAQAVLVVGSHVRGEARGSSDIDLWAVGRTRPDLSMSVRSGRLVSVLWRSVAGYRRELRHPPNLVGAVPGWRHALIVHDPRGVALRIQQEARRWRWADVAATCDRWVADQVAGYAEEVGKLVNALRDGERTRISVQRSVLGLRLAMIAAVHHRLLVESENYLWDRVAQLLGPAGPASRRSR